MQSHHRTIGEAYGPNLFKYLGIRSIFSSFICFEEKHSIKIFLANDALLFYLLLVLQYINLELIYQDEDIMRIIKREGLRSLFNHEANLRLKY
jgi:hypothetical protein